MSHTCQTCDNFDPDGTGLPVCLLHRRFMHGEWSCGDHSDYAKDGEDGREVNTETEE